MSWKNELRQGSFRGVPFFVRSADDGAGRRRAQHIYAGREEPFSEDLGRKQREYTLSAYCLGADYFDQRDALEKALNQKGPGLLVHPWRGQLQVTVDYRVQHNTADGGMCVFTLNCTEAGHDENPDQVIDTSSGLLSTIDSSKLSVLDKFKSSFSTAGFSNYVKTDAIVELSKVAATVAVMPGQLSSNSSSSIMGNLTPLLADSGALGTAIYSLIGSTAKISNNFRTGGADLNITPSVKNNTAKQGISNLQSFNNYQTTKTAEIYPTTSGMQATKNADAITTLVKESAAVESAHRLALYDYSDVFLHKSEADTTVDGVCKQLLELSYNAADQQYYTLNRTRIAVLDDYRSRGVALGSIYHVKPQQTQPAMVIAYRYYGDVYREADLLNINAIDHPGFVAGGHNLGLLNA